MRCPCGQRKYASAWLRIGPGFYLIRPSRPLETLHPLPSSAPPLLALGTLLLPWGSGCSYPRPHPLHLFPVWRLLRPPTMSTDHYRYRDRSASRGARDQSPSHDNLSDEGVVVDEDEPVLLEPRERVPPVRAHLIRALALLCACSLSVGSH